MAPPPPPGILPPPLDATAAALLSPDHRPNPEYHTLYQAYVSAYGDVDRLRGALDPAVRTMGGTDAWLGPEARSWQGDLEAERVKLRKAADRFLWDIYDRLSVTTRTITRA
ncbi:hypothetical protein [Actinomadura flavalba]|uniref:hypothetical protein n=1 Tax=Actinomadura flavalba TaxID=1120938 RepID=UPI000375198C|nr:hypothetical protein [Actinomadura flavalba]